MKKIMLSNRFEKALLWAVDMHAGQFRKGTNIPYISHLLAVASIVLENGDNEDEVIAALLHDAAEDSGGKETLEKIKDEFGEKVAEIVAACTDTYDDPKPEWRLRKENYIKHLPKAPVSAQLVSLADKLHNARSIYRDYLAEGEMLWDRFNGKKDGTLWYYRQLIITCQKLNYPKHQLLVQELDKVVTEIEDLASS